MLNTPRSCLALGILGSAIALTACTAGTTGNQAEDSAVAAVPSSSAAASQSAEAAMVPVSRDALVCVDFLCPPEGALTQQGDRLFVDGEYSRTIVHSGTLAGVTVGEPITQVREQLGQPTWTLTLQRVVDIYADDTRTLLVEHADAEDTVAAVTEMAALPFPSDKPLPLFPDQEENDPGVRPHTMFRVLAPFDHEGNPAPGFQVTEGASLRCSTQQVAGIAPGLQVCGDTPQVCTVTDGQALCVDPGAVIGSDGSVAGSTAAGVGRTGVLTRHAVTGSMSYSPVAAGAYDPFWMRSVSGTVYRAAGTTDYNTVDKVDAVWQGDDLINEAVWVNYSD